MGFDGIWAEILDPASDAVIKARADIDHQIATMHRHICLIQPVHPQHPQPVFARGRITAQPHQGRGHRNICCMGQLNQKLTGGGAGINHTTAGIKYRALGFFDQFDQGGDGLDIAFYLRLVARIIDLFGRGVIAIGKLHVFWNVDQHGAGAPCGGQMKALVNNAGQIVGVSDQPVMFGAGPRDANGVGLLKRVISDHECRHLTG